MARKVAALLLALLLALIPRALLGTVFGQTQDIVAELVPGAYPYLMTASAGFELLIAYAMAFVTGFAFWAGTAETWKASGAWAASACVALMAAGAPFEGPLLLALALLVRVGGAFSGAWWGECNKDDPRVEGVQGFIFKVNPFRLT